MAMGEDPDNFDPNEELADYDEVARSLPVFCCSSRAYGKLRGQFRKEKRLIDFETREATEVPQLQDHTIVLTVQTRLDTCVGFLSSFDQLLMSMDIWVENGSFQHHHDAAEKAQREAEVKSMLHSLDMVSTEASLSSDPRLMESLF